MAGAGQDEAIGAVWKQSHRVSDVIVLELPVGSTLLHAADPGDSTSLDFWFFVPDLKAATSIPPQVEERTLGVVGTGHTIDPKKWCPADYWMTVLKAGGSLGAWHIFKEGKG